MGITQKPGTFDYVGFYAAVDAARIAKRISMREVARQAGISPATVSRLGSGKRPNVETLAALTCWAGLQVDWFIRRRGMTAKNPLARILALIMADSSLSLEARNSLARLVRVVYRELTCGQGVERRA